MHTQDVSLARWPTLPPRLGSTPRSPIRRHSCTPKQSPHFLDCNCGVEIEDNPPMKSYSSLTKFKYIFGQNAGNPGVHYRERNSLEYIHKKRGKTDPFGTQTFLVFLTGGNTAENPQRSPRGRERGASGGGRLALRRGALRADLLDLPRGTHQELVLPRHVGRVAGGVVLVDLLRRQDPVPCCTCRPGSPPPPPGRCKLWCAGHI